jgi:hypothetical protein
MTENVDILVIHRGGSDPANRLARFAFATVRSSIRVSFQPPTVSAARQFEHPEDRLHRRWLSVPFHYSSSASAAIVTTVWKGPSNSLNLAGVPAKIEMKLPFRSPNRQASLTMDVHY